ncbi:MAG: hypothetical protein ACYS5V_10020 [Planctomycetota bacterium]|jgi:hypothetical protein
MPQAPEKDSTPEPDAPQEHWLKDETITAFLAAAGVEVTKPTIPEVLDRFVDYFRRNPTWGDLHIVLDDGNVRDSDVQWCVDHGRTEEGRELARVLLRMSRTQRLKLPNRVDEVDRAHRRMDEKRESANTFERMARVIQPMAVSLAPEEMVEHNRGAERERWSGQRLALVIVDDMEVTGG